MGTADSDFVIERTLGGQAAEFWWRADELGNLAIRRVAARGQTHAAKGRLVRSEELESLLAWMAQREWVLLECLPGKVRDGTAKDGLGRFLCRELGWPPAEATFASHVATVLARAEVLTWNGKKRDMAFRLVTADLGRVRARYELLRAKAAAEAGESRPRQPEPPAAPRRPKPGGPLPPQLDLYERFRALSRELRAQIDSVSGGYHPVEKGGRREAAVRAFLRRVLPGRYRVASGEIVHSSYETSPQVDALIYDSAAPVLLDADASVVVAAESVLAAIEVKPLLRGPELAEAVASLRAVKALRPMTLFRPWGGRAGPPRPTPNPPAFTALFSIDSVQPRHILQTLHELERDTAPALALDCVCMLDRGIIFRAPGLLEPPRPLPPVEKLRPQPLVLLESGDDSLLLFYILLFEQLTLRPSQLPDLRAYAHGLPISKPIFAWPSEKLNA